MADVAVANVVANGLMQHPDVPQDSHSVSFETQAFFRAEGPPVTLELPLPPSPTANRIVPVRGHNNISFEDDSAIRRMAAEFGLHQCFGPSPSMQMLIQDLAVHAQAILASLPMKEPLPVHS